MTDFSNFEAGVYRHYKGPHYMVFGLGHDANNDKRVVVMYIGLELDSNHTGPRWAVRDYDDFYAWVDPATGEAVDPKASGAVRRFTYLGPTWKDEPA